VPRSGRADSGSATRACRTALDAASSLRGAEQPVPERAPLPALAPSGPGCPFAQTPARAANGPPPGKDTPGGRSVSLRLLRRKGSLRATARRWLHQRRTPCYWRVCASRPQVFAHGHQRNRIKVSGGRAQAPSHPPELRQFGSGGCNRSSWVVCACRTRSAHSDTGAKQRRRSRAGVKVSAPPSMFAPGSRPASSSSRLFPGMLLEWDDRQRSRAS